MTIVRDAVTWGNPSRSNAGGVETNASDLFCGNAACCVHRVPDSPRSKPREPCTATAQSRKTTQAPCGIGFRTNAEATCPCAVIKNRVPVDVCCLAIWSPRARSRALLTATLARWEFRQARVCEIPSPKRHRLAAHQLLSVSTAPAYSTWHSRGGLSG